MKTLYECGHCGFPVEASYVNTSGGCANCGTGLQPISARISAGSAGSWIFGFFVGIFLIPVVKEITEAEKRALQRIK